MRCMSLVFSQLGTAGWEVGGGVKGVPFGLRACDVKPSSFLVEVVSGHAEFIPSVSRSGPMVREGGGGLFVTASAAALLCICWLLGVFPFYLWMF